MKTLKENIQKITVNTILVTAFLLLRITTTYAQKSYQIEIAFSGSNFDRAKMDIQFDDGYKTLSLANNSLSKILENRTSWLNFPTLDMIYNSSKTGAKMHRFFLINDTSRVTIYYDSLTDDIRIQKTSGLLSFDNAGQRKFEVYAQKERETLDAFSRKYNDDFTRVDSTVLKQFETYFEAVTDKALSFVKANPTLLYSLWLFRAQIVWDRRYAKSDLSHIYQRVFKGRHTNSFEGNFILTKLDTTRLGVGTRIPGQQQDFKDLAGRTHRMNSFTGRPLIIMVWATWCVPCVAEIPKLKEILAKFKNKLEVITFSDDNSEEKVRGFVSNQRMDWINVYGRRDLCRLYGSDLGLPQLYLVDKKGVIVYSRSKMEDYDLDKLEKFIEETISEQ